MGCMFNELVVVLVLVITSDFISELFLLNPLAVIICLSFWGSDNKPLSWK